MVLAAGRGERLFPLTATIPKCMVPVAGRPLLELSLERLRASGISEAVINLHYHAGVVRDHFGDGSRFGLSIRYSEEPELTGTAGALRCAREQLDETFLLWFGDNLSNCDLHALWQVHDSVSPLTTLAVHWREDVRSSGLVECDDEKRILRFQEKPVAEKAFSGWVNAGISIVERRMIDRIPETIPVDLGREIYPSLVAEGKVAAYPMSRSEHVWWVDFPRDLEYVRQREDEIRGLLANGTAN